MFRALPGGDRRPPLKLGTKITLLVTGVACLALLLLGGAAVWTAGLAHEAAVGRQNLKLARLLAEMPEVRAGLAAPDPAAVLQPLAERLRRTLGVDLIVVIGMDRIRYSHYDPRYVKTLYSAGDEARALRGESYVSKCSCVGVQSVRGLAPVRAPDGRQVGVVVVGTFVDNVAAGTRQLQAALGVSLAVSLAVAAAAARWVARSIKASLFGLEPPEIASLLRERELILQSIREGLVAVGRDGRITLMNEAARALAGVQGDPVGRPADEVVPELRLVDLLAGDSAQEDVEVFLGQRVVLLSRIPVTEGGRVVGALVTFRDKTEVTRLAEELTGVRRFVEAVRAQNHEFLNKLQTLAGLIHLGSYDEALAFIAQTTRGRQEAMGRLLAAVRDAATVGLLMGKLSEAQEKGVELVVDPGSRVNALPPHFDSSAMVCVLGNLVENAIEALAAGPRGARRVTVAVREEPDHLHLEVADNGPGIPPDMRTRIFRRGVSTKSPGRGLGLYLVRARVEQAGGEITVDCPPEGGSRFVVRIPRQLPGSAAGAAVG
ncbi:ATP-binding protein [Caldinitratiruptor microaerophilus]|uniref:histidine kinase n=1 Tax=Caldinitratiruptor microaerophilus TaxID=671077 RepID=A0AA35CQD9_9FIRM|nr:sensor histidine kinase [Caldinitratiruptor microaerophilus]BDG62036.1 histidine kinase [Caldinitratiruptor microaerophilus]